MRSHFMRTILTDVMGLIDDAKYEQDRLNRFLEFYKDKEIPPPPPGVIYSFTDDDLSLYTRHTYTTFEGFDTSLRIIRKYIYSTFRAELPLSRVEKNGDDYTLVFISGVHRNSLSFTIVLYMQVEENVINESIAKHYEEDK